MTYVLIAAGVIIATLGYALYAEVVKNLELGTMIIDLGSQVDHLRVKRQAFEVHAMAEIAELRLQLAQAQFHRDLRPPSHPVIEYLAANGPTDIFGLIDHFGPEVGIEMGKLITDGTPIRSDANHDWWWVEPTVGLTVEPVQPTGGPRIDSETMVALIPTHGPSESVLGPTVVPSKAEWAQSLTEWAAS